MQELSLNILDIVQNSIKAEATCIDIIILENIDENLLEIVIEDNGVGMSEEFLRKVVDPFTTTRTTRSVGLGIPLFKAAAEDSGGEFIIDSKVGEGTIIKANFKHDHIDRQPMGDIAGAIFSIVSANTHLDIYYQHIVGGKSFTFDTAAIRDVLDGAPMDDLDVLMWIKGYLTEGILSLY